MKLTRRTLLAGAAAVPALAGLDRLSAAQPGGAGILLYDPALPQARLLADNPAARPITGDRIRFAQELFARRPAFVRGVSRQGDAVLIADVAREAGYWLTDEQVTGGIIEWLLVPGR